MAGGSHVESMSFVPQNFTAGNTHILEMVTCMNPTTAPPFKIEANGKPCHFTNLIEATRAISNPW